MVDDNVNLGFHALNVPDYYAPRTAVVLGLPRSGTTMVAAILHHLGVHIGDDLTPVMEDRPLSNAVENGDIDAVRRIVADRNKRYDVWGWKRPSSRNHLDTVRTEMRNPYYLMVLRDPLASATRKHRSVGADVIEAMQSHAHAQRRLVELASTLDEPLLLMSYEKCVTHPQRAVEAIAGFLGVAVIDEAVACVQPDAPDYVKATRPTGR